MTGTHSRSAGETLPRSPARWPGRTPGIGVVTTNYILDESPTLYFLCQGLVEAGYRVDLYSDVLDSEKGIYAAAGVTVHTMHPGGNGGHRDRGTTQGGKERPEGVGSGLRDMASRVSPPALRLTRSLFNRLPRSWRERIAFWLVPRTNAQCTATRRYGAFLRARGIGAHDLLVVVEPEGLMAFHFCRTDLPFVYLSLELNNLSFEKGGAIHLFKKALERRMIPRAAFSIIQDKARESVFRHDNRIPAAHPILHLPVSFRGEMNQRRSNHFREKFGIPADRRIVLYAGSIMPWACLEEIIGGMDNWGDRFVLVIHGARRDEGYLRRLRELCGPDGRVHFSTDWVDYHRLDEVIASAEIGISAYVEESLNNRLTLFASGKVAAYLKSGLPVITRRFDGTDRFYAETGCGECFDDFGEIGPILERMDRDYANYRERAFAAFDTHFRFDRHFEKVLGGIRRIIREVGRS